MNDRALKIKAFVDWVDVQIETNHSTNFQTVQRAFAAALRLPTDSDIHVTAINPNEGGGTCLFVARLNDIRRYSDLEAILNRVGAELSLMPGFSIVRIELAIDAYCNAPADQAASFYKFLANPVSNNRRMYRDFRGSGKAMPCRLQSITRHLSEGWQIGIGNKTEERYQHIYVKDSDTINGRRQEVPKRARLEIRLSGAALLHQTSDQWKQFKFEGLADYFRQRELKSDLDPTLQTLAEASGQIGERKTRNRREGGIRQYSKTTKAAPINEAIRSALKNLSRSWKGTGKRKSAPRTVQ